MHTGLQIACIGAVFACTYLLNYSSLFLNFKHDCALHRQKKREIVDAVVANKYLDL